MTKKPELSEAQREARLHWCLAHKDWTIEDWKKVIWSDETGVVLGHRRGAYRVWRRPWERGTRSCIRERWKGYTEFQFWGCFSWDYKGPCHVWEAETAQEKKEAEEILRLWNEANEPAAKKAWEEAQKEAEAERARSRQRRKPGPKPKWKFSDKTGKLVRVGKGGIG